VTDTQESTLDSGAGNAASATSPSRAAAKRRSGSLSTMLLPELQQLAGSLGIASTKLKKSDLVQAIQSAQTGQSPQARANGAGSSGADSNGSANTASANGAGRSRSRAPRASSPTDSPAAAETASSSSDGAIQPTLSPALDQPDTATAPSGTANGSRPANDNSGQRRDRNRAGNSDQRERNQGGQNQNNNRPSNGNQPNNNNQSSSSGQGGNSRGSGDDDYDDGPRRGRRYRDRRGRTRDQRDRVGSVGNADVEPTVSDDDVLVPVAGILDAVEDKNTWFVRTSGYVSGPDDVYVANSYIRRFNLRRGDAVTGAIKALRDGERREKYNPLVRLDTVNGVDPEQSKNRVEFTKLTPLYPQERLRLETEPHILTTRVIDLVMPIGKGQRALIVSPPKAGKTSVLQAIANAIATNNPECHLMVVLVDERPEEVTDMQRSVKGEVIASTFDRRPQDHIQIAELSIERAKRLVEMGHDVVVLLDSITRLGRAYNLGAPASGRILSGGVDSTALYPPKRFLGAARNIENGGSLTILCTALVETGSAGDTVIFEEFKGTGNAELKLDRKIADKRVFPAVDVDQSSTRKEELLLSPDELAVTIKLRRVLHSLEQQQAIDLLLDRLRKTRTNLEFLMQIAKTTPGGD
jgi:transcription termination factor Rho